MLGRVYRKLFVRKRFYGFHKKLYSAAISGLGVFNFDEGQLTGEDCFLRNLRKITGTDAPTVLDVGAHHGEYSSKVKTIYPLAKIYAFEPNPESYIEVKQVAERLGFTAINTGMSDAAGNAILFDRVSVGSQQATMYEGIIESVFHDSAVRRTIKLDTVDAFLEANNIAKIDLLKSDTEGHDFKVLQGAKDAILSGKVNLIHFEFNEMNVFSKTFMKDFEDFLCGFTLYRMLPDGLVKLTDESIKVKEIFAFQNIVASKNGNLY